MTNLFGDHFHPVIVLFAPLFWIAPAAETLLVAQAALLALSIVPVFVYARDRLPRRDRPRHGRRVRAVLGDAADRRVRRARGRVRAACRGIAAPGDGSQGVAVVYVAAVPSPVKEDLTPFLMCVGAYLWLRGERWRGGALLVTSLAAFMVIVGLVIPAASDAGGTDIAGRMPMRSSIRGTSRSAW